MTKEVDFRVAKAYVSLADGDPTMETRTKESTKRARTGSGAGDPDRLEERAVDQYLDDEEWEAEQRRLGQKPLIRGFPYFDKSGGEGVSRGQDASGSSEKAGGSRWALFRQIAAA